MIEYVILGSIVTVAVAGTFIAKMWLKTDEYSGKLKKNMERYVAELEEENKHLTKSINAMKRGAKIAEEDLDNPIDAIQALIPQFEHLVPAKFKPFLRDPKILEYATKMISEHPEEAKKLLSNFVSKKGRNNELVPDEEAAMSV